MKFSVALKIVISTSKNLFTWHSKYNVEGITSSKGHQVTIRYGVGEGEIKTLSTSFLVVGVYLLLYSVE